MREQIEAKIKSHVNSTNWAEELSLDILALIRQEIEKVENPTETGDKPFNKNRYEGFEQARKAILERLK